MVGFASQTIKSEGKISLPLSVGDNVHMVEFLIMFSPSLYNCIMGRLALNQLQVKVSTRDLSMEIPIREEIQMIYGDQKAADECYFATVKEVEKI